MKGFGAALIIFGLILILCAVGMDTSVETQVPSSILSTISVPQHVANLEKMQTQMMLLQSGLVAFLAGIVLAAGGAIRDAIERTREVMGGEVTSPLAPPAQPGIGPATAPKGPPTEEELERIRIAEEEGRKRDRQSNIIGAILLGGIILVVVVSVLIRSSHSDAGPGGTMNLTSDNVLLDNDATANDPTNIGSTLDSGNAAAP